MAPKIHRLRVCAWACEADVKQNRQGIRAARRPTIQFRDPDGPPASSRALPFVNRISLGGVESRKLRCSLRTGSRRRDVMECVGSLSRDWRCRGVHGAPARMRAKTLSRRIGTRTGSRMATVRKSGEHTRACAESPMCPAGAGSARQAREGVLRR